MIGVDKIDDIRRFGRNGGNVASISQLCCRIEY